MDVPKTDVGGSNREPGAGPQREVRVYPTQTGAATECAPNGPSENGGKVKKMTEKQWAFRPRARKPIV
jgi:hypothetical protein